MHIEYDASADILRVLFTDAAIDESDEIQPGVIADYDTQGNMVGIEVLDASKKINTRVEMIPALKAS